MSLVVDVHTHMLSERWMATLKEHGGPRYAVKPTAGGAEVIHMDGAPFMTPLPEMFDYDARIRNMDKARVDVAVVSLTCPNVFWGGREISAATARAINDDMAQAQTAYPDRIRWFASLPWQHADLALAELERARGMGAAGVVTLGNIDGASLTDPAFAPIWEAIDRADVPVFVHPTAPPGVAQMDMVTHNLVPAIGFVFDTSLAIARCIYDGFFDRYPNVRLIAGHGGGALPYLVGRLDTCHAKIPACGARSADAPRNYMRRIFVDAVVYTQEALEMCVKVCGSENVMFGSDYPHNLGDMIGCLGRIDALPDGVRERVRGGNAARMFGLS